MKIILVNIGKKIKQIDYFYKPKTIGWYLHFYYLRLRNALKYRKGKTWHFYPIMNPGLKPAIEICFKRRLKNIKKRFTMRIGNVLKKGDEKNG